eukprot:14696652-Alexandrium_andersonii.AAC.1
MPSTPGQPGQLTELRLACSPNLCAPPGLLATPGFAALALPMCAHATCPTGEHLQPCPASSTCRGLRLRMAPTATPTRA